MAINTLITSNLGCGETDLPATNALFHQLEQAGLSPESLSEHALLRCARLAIREEARSGLIGRSEAFTLYSHIHDLVVAPVDSDPSLV